MKIVNKIRQLQIKIKDLEESSEARKKYIYENHKGGNKMAFLIDFMPFLTGFSIALMTKFISVRSIFIKVLKVKMIQLIKI